MVLEQNPWTELGAPKVRMAKHIIMISHIRHRHRHRHLAVPHLDLRHQRKTVSANSHPNTKYYKR